MAKKSKQKPEMGQDVSGGIDSLNAKLEGYPYKLSVLSFDKLELLERNARYITGDQFNNLVENIKRDGGMQSIPFCVLQKNGKYRVLSGNHRAQAAKKAGLKSILVLYSDAEMTRQQEVAVQLAHNAICGQDDITILRELYEEMDDISLKYYSGITDADLEKMEKLSIPPLSEIPISYRQTTIVFLPEEQGQLEAAFDEARQRISSNDVYLARFAEFDGLLDALEEVRETGKVKNVATAMMLILAVFNRHKEELPDIITELAKKAGVPV